VQGGPIQKNSRSACLLQVARPGTQFFRPGSVAGSETVTTRRPSFSNVRLRCQGWSHVPILDWYIFVSHGRPPSNFCRAGTIPPLVCLSARRRTTQLTPLCSILKDPSFNSPLVLPEFQKTSITFDPSPPLSSQLTPLRSILKDPSFNSPLVLPEFQKTSITFDPSPPLSFEQPIQHSFFGG
jgi:hypothetical protein